MATTSRTTSKYQDVILRSTKISEERPVKYKLEANTTSIGSLTRVSVGKYNCTKINKTVLLVGETGAGKSTLINALFNLSLGVTFKDNVWFQLVDEKKKPGSVSQTSDVIVYQIFDFQDTTLRFSLTIIDTPGFGDTEGIHRDAIIMQRLLDLFLSNEGVHEVNTVGLVMKVGTNRLDERLKYIFDSVLSLFDKGLEKNIVALITHSSGFTPEDTLDALVDANVKCAKNATNRPLHYLFENMHNLPRTEENNFALENTWWVSVRGVDQFMKFLYNTGPQKLDRCVEVLNSRRRLTACVHNLQTRIFDIELKQAEIQQIQNVLHKHEVELLSTGNFIIEYDEVYKERVALDTGMWGLVFYEGVTRCTVCEENCHYPGCTMAWSPKQCVVMLKDRCTICTMKCPVSAHVKDNQIYVSKQRKAWKTNEDLRKKFEEKKVQTEREATLLESLEREMMALKEQEQQWLEDAYNHIIRLKRNALKFDSVSTSIHFDFLIKKMTKNGDIEKARNLETMQNEMDKRTKSALQYAWNRLTAATGLQSSPK